MKTVVDETTGEVKYCFFEDCQISENELIIGKPATGSFYDFKTEEFYSN